MGAPILALIQEVLNNEDLRSIIFSTLKPHSDKLRLAQCSKQFCRWLCESSYAAWLLGNHLAALRRREQSSKMKVLNAPRWCACGCFDIIQAVDSVAISLLP